MCGGIVKIDCEYLPEFQPKSLARLEYICYNANVVIKKHAY